MMIWMVILVSLLSVIVNIKLIAVCYCYFVKLRKEGVCVCVFT